MWNAGMRGAEEGGGRDQEELGLKLRLNPRLALPKGAARFFSFGSGQRSCRWDRDTLWL